MIRLCVSNAENRHESIAEIFVYQSAMVFLDDTDCYPKKMVHHLNHFSRSRGARSGSPGTHVDKHDRDFFLDTAQPRVMRQYLFGGTPTNMQAECLTQLLLIS